MGSFMKIKTMRKLPAIRYLSRLCSMLTSGSSCSNLCSPNQHSPIWASHTIQVLPSLHAWISFFTASCSYYTFFLVFLVNYVCKDSSRTIYIAFWDPWQTLKFQDCCRNSRTGGASAGRKAEKTSTQGWNQGEWSLPNECQRVHFQCLLLSQLPVCD